MRCEKVLGQLSLFVDDMLPGDLAAEVSQHLCACPGCSLEGIRLKKLRNALHSLPPVETPDYLRRLVDLKINNCGQRSWRTGFRRACEYRWARIRSTEGMWYLTRLTGVMATIVFFVAIYSSMNSIYMDLSHLPANGGWLSPDQRTQKLVRDFRNVFGITSMESQKKPISPSEPKINPEYLLNFAEKSSRTAHDDSVTILTHIDRSGSASLQDVLEYPADDSLLNEFADMIMSAGWKPATQNGKAVDSRLVLSFSKVYVYN